MKIKKSSIAGKFYPSDKNQLLAMLDDFYSCSNNTSEYFSRAIIVPHAGYVFSGKLAMQGYKYLNPATERIFIFAPSHYARLFGCVSCSFDEFQTPLGNCFVDVDIVKDFEINDEAFQNEHSIEIHLPFIKYFFPNAKIVPILYGCEDYKNIANYIKKYWNDKTNSFVMSSDLSHFYPERESIKIDSYTAQMIESGNIQNFDVEQACGAVGVCGIVEFAKSLNFNLIRIGLTNSAKMTGDSSKVVGYGSWFLYEGSFADYLKNIYSDLIIDICKKSISSGLQLGDFEINSYPAALDETGACFVTLKIDGELRGCMGSAIAHQPLIVDLIENAHSAAFKDPRFEPLSLDEFKFLEVSVSILSSPSRISFSSEVSLLEKITPYEDGLIIRDGDYQAVYLPVVWEYFGGNKERFLKSLKLKAGMSEDYFSDTMQVFRFKAIEISQ